MVCDGCGKEKPATVTLDTTTLISLRTTLQAALQEPCIPFSQLAYEIDETVNEAATWRALGPGPRIVCSEACYQKVTLRTAPPLDLDVIGIDRPMPPPPLPPVQVPGAPPEWQPRDPSGLVPKD